MRRQFSRYGIFRAYGKVFGEFCLGRAVQCSLPKRRAFQLHFHRRIGKAEIGIAEIIRRGGKEHGDICVVIGRRGSMQPCPRKRKAVCAVRQHLFLRFELNRKAVRHHRFDTERPCPFLSADFYLCLP